MFSNCDVVSFIHFWRSCSVIDGTKLIVGQLDHIPMFYLELIDQCVDSRHLLIIIASFRRNSHKRVPIFVSVLVWRDLVLILNFLYSLYSYVYAFDRFFGLVVRVPAYITEMYCASCEVRTQFIYVM
jgi:hypothetical protein